VVTWAEHVGVIDAVTAERARVRILNGDSEFAGFLAAALALREAIHRVAAAIADQATPLQEDLGIIKAACARAIASSDLSPGAQGFRWSWRTDPPGPQTILGPVALSAAGLLREGDLSRLKQCKGEHCGWLFFDMTKNNSRRWCDMAVCGNRQKSRRHRQRQAFSATEVQSN
jgi:predicted RNA-binding Zn ribbon-like protein